jgi:hypothetical protein
LIVIFISVCEKKESHQSDFAKLNGEGSLCVVILCAWELGAWGTGMAEERGREMDWAVGSGVGEAGIQSGALIGLARAELN